MTDNGEAHDVEPTAWRRRTRAVGGKLKPPDRDAEKLSIRNPQSLPRED